MFNRNTIKDRIYSILNNKIKKAEEDLVIGNKEIDAKYNEDVKTAQLIAEDRKNKLVDNLIIDLFSSLQDSSKIIVK